MQSDLNLKIKFRESFRPFAPCVLREHVHEWFQMRPGEDSPYMLLVAPVLEARRVPLSDEQHATTARTTPTSPTASTSSAAPSRRSPTSTTARASRPSTSGTADSTACMKAFHDKTGCPIIVNTSFNLSWEPIVLTPEQAYHTFMQSEMDVLVLEDCVLRKDEQPLGMQSLGRRRGEGRGRSMPPGPIR